MKNEYNFDGNTSWSFSPRMTSDERITCDVGNTALVVLVSTHPDIAVIAPRLTPGVLSDVVILLGAAVVESVIANKDK